MDSVTIFFLGFILCTSLPSITGNAVDAKSLARLHCYRRTEGRECDIPFTNRAGHCRLIRECPIFRRSQDLIKAEMMTEHLNGSCHCDAGPMMVCCAKNWERLVDPVKRKNFLEHFVRRNKQRRRPGRHRVNTVRRRIQLSGQDSSLRSGLEDGDEQALKDDPVQDLDDSYIQDLAEPTNLGPERRAAATSYKAINKPFGIFSYQQRSTNDQLTDTQEEPYNIFQSKSPIKSKAKTTSSLMKETPKNKNRTSAANASLSRPTRSTQDIQVNSNQSPPQGGKPGELWATLLSTVPPVVDKGNPITASQQPSIDNKVPQMNAFNVGTMSNNGRPGQSRPQNYYQVQQMPQNYNQNQQMPQNYYQSQQMAQNYYPSPQIAQNYYPSSQAAQNNYPNPHGLQNPNQLRNPNYQFQTGQTNEQLPQAYQSPQGFQSQPRPLQGAYEPGNSQNRNSYSQNAGQRLPASPGSQNRYYPNRPQESNSQPTQSSWNYYDQRNSRPSWSDAQQFFPPLYGQGYSQPFPAFPNTYGQAFTPYGQPPVNPYQPIPINAFGQQPIYSYNPNPYLVPPANPWLQNPYQMAPGLLPPPPPPPPWNTFSLHLDQQGFLQNPFYPAPGYSAYGVVASGHTGMNPSIHPVHGQLPQPDKPDGSQLDVKPTQSTLLPLPVPGFPVPLIPYNVPGYSYYLSNMYSTYNPYGILPYEKPLAAPPTAPVSSVTPVLTTGSTSSTHLPREPHRSPQTIPTRPEGRNETWGMQLGPSVFIVPNRFSTTSPTETRIPKLHPRLLPRPDLTTKDIKGPSITLPLWPDINTTTTTETSFAPEGTTFHDQKRTGTTPTTTETSFAPEGTTFHDQKRTEMNLFNTSSSSFITEITSTISPDMKVTTTSKPPTTTNTSDDVSKRQPFAVHMPSEGASLLSRNFDSTVHNETETHKLLTEPQVTADSTPASEDHPSQSNDDELSLKSSTPPIIEVTTKPMLPPDVLASDWVDIVTTTSPTLVLSSPFETPKVLSVDKYEVTSDVRVTESSMNQEKNLTELHKPASFEQTSFIEPPQSNVSGGHEIQLIPRRLGPSDDDLADSMESNSTEPKSQHFQAEVPRQTSDSPDMNETESSASKTTKTFEQTDSPVSPSIFEKNDFLALNKTEGSTGNGSSPAIKQKADNISTDLIPVDRKQMPKESEYPNVLTPKLINISALDSEKSNETEVPDSISEHIYEVRNASNGTKASHSETSNIASSQTTQEESVTVTAPTPTYITNDSSNTPDGKLSTDNRGSNETANQDNESDRMNPTMQVHASKIPIIWPTANEENKTLMDNADTTLAPKLFEPKVTSNIEITDMAQTASLYELVTRDMGKKTMTPLPPFDVATATTATTYLEVTEYSQTTNVIAPVSNTRYETTSNNMSRIGTLEQTMEAAESTSTTTLEDNGPQQSTASYEKDAEVRQENNTNYPINSMILTPRHFVNMTGEVGHENVTAAERIFGRSEERTAAYSETTIDMDKTHSPIMNTTMLTPPSVAVYDQQTVANNDSDVLEHLEDYTHLTDTVATLSTPSHFEGGLAGEMTAGVIASMKNGPQFPVASNVTSSIQEATDYIHTSEVNPTILTPRLFEQLETSTASVTASGQPTAVGNYTSVGERLEDEVRSPHENATMLTPRKFEQMARAAIVNVSGSNNNETRVMNGNPPDHPTEARSDTADHAHPINNTNLSNDNATMLTPREFEAEVGAVTVSTIATDQPNVVSNGTVYLGHQVENSNPGDEYLPMLITRNFEEHDDEATANVTDSDQSTTVSNYTIYMGHLVDKPHLAEENSTTFTPRKFAEVAGTSITNVTASDQPSVLGDLVNTSHSDDASVAVGQLDAIDDGSATANISDSGQPSVNNTIEMRHQVHNDHSGMEKAILLTQRQFEAIAGAATAKVTASSHPTALSNDTVDVGSPVDNSTAEKLTGATIANVTAYDQPTEANNDTINARHPVEDAHAKENATMLTPREFEELAGAASPNFKANAQPIVLSNDTLGMGHPVDDDQYKKNATMSLAGAAISNVTAKPIHPVDQPTVVSNGTTDVWHPVDNNTILTPREFEELAGAATSNVTANDQPSVVSNDTIDVEQPVNDVQPTENATVLTQRQFEELAGAAITNVTANDPPPIGSNDTLDVGHPVDNHTMLTSREFKELVGAAISNVTANDQPTVGSNDVIGLGNPVDDVHYKENSTMLTPRNVELPSAAISNVTANDQPTVGSNDTLDVEHPVEKNAMLTPREFEELAGANITTNDQPTEVSNETVDVGNQVNRNIILTPREFEELAGAAIANITDSNQPATVRNDTIDVGHQVVKAHSATENVPMLKPRKFEEMADDADFNATAFDQLAYESNDTTNVGHLEDNAHSAKENATLLTQRQFEQMAGVAAANIKTSDRHNETKHSVATIHSNDEVVTLTPRQFEQLAGGAVANTKDSSHPSDISNMTIDVELPAHNIHPAEENVTVLTPPQFSVITEAATVDEATNHQPNAERNGSTSDEHQVHSVRSPYFNGTALTPRQFEEMVGAAQLANEGGFESKGPQHNGEKNKTGNVVRTLQNPTMPLKNATTLTSQQFEEMVGAAEPINVTTLQSTGPLQTAINNETGSVEMQEGDLKSPKHVDDLTGTVENTNRNIGVGSLVRQVNNTSTDNENVKLNLRHFEEPIADAQNTTAEANETGYGERQVVAGINTENDNVKILTPREFEKMAGAVGDKNSTAENYTVLSSEEVHNVNVVNLTSKSEFETTGIPGQLGDVNVAGNTTLVSRELLPASDSLEQIGMPVNINMTEMMPAGTINGSIILTPRQFEKMVAAAEGYNAPFNGTAANEASASKNETLKHNIFDGIGGDGEPANQTDTKEMPVDNATIPTAESETTAFYTNTTAVNNGLFYATTTAVPTEATFSLLATPVLSPPEKQDNLTITNGTIPVFPTNKHGESGSNESALMPRRIGQKDIVTDADFGETSKNRSTNPVSVIDDTVSDGTKTHKNETGDRPQDSSQILSAIVLNVTARLDSNATNTANNSFFANQSPDEVTHTNLTSTVISEDNNNQNVTGNGNEKNDSAFINILNDTVNSPLSRVAGDENTTEYTAEIKASLASKSFGSMDSTSAVNNTNESLSATNNYDRQGTSNVSEDIQLSINASPTSISTTSQKFNESTISHEDADLRQVPNEFKEGLAQRQLQSNSKSDPNLINVNNSALTHANQTDVDLSVAPFDTISSKNAENIGPDSTPTIKTSVEDSVMQSTSSSQTTEVMLGTSPTPALEDSTSTDTPIIITTLPYQPSTTEEEPEWGEPVAVIASHIDK